MRELRARILRPLAILTAAAAAFVGLGATPAAADDFDGCPYPYVCLYNHWDTFGLYFYRYQVVTDYYQVPPVRTGSFTVANSRNDDVVHVRWKNGAGTHVNCLPPNRAMQNSGTITGIMIRPESTC